MLQMLHHLHGADAGQGAADGTDGEEDGHVVDQLAGVEDEDGQGDLAGVVGRAADDGDHDGADLFVAGEKGHQDHADEAAGEGIHHRGNTAEQDAAEDDLEQHQAEGSGNIQHIYGKEQHTVAEADFDARHRGNREEAFHISKDQHHGQQQGRERDPFCLFVHDDPLQKNN